MLYFEIWGARRKPVLEKLKKKKKEETHVQQHTAERERESCARPSQTRDQASLSCVRLRPLFIFSPFGTALFPQHHPPTLPRSSWYASRFAFSTVSVNLAYQADLDTYLCLSRNAISPVHLVNHENVNVWTIWNKTKSCLYYKRNYLIKTFQHGCWQLVVVHENG